MILANLSIKTSVFLIREITQADTGITGSDTMKTVSPLKPTSLFLVLNLAPPKGANKAPNCGAAPPDPREAAPPLASGGRLCLPWAAPHPVAHQKEKGIFIFGGSGGRVWVCGKWGSLWVGSWVTWVQP